MIDTILSHWDLSTDLAMWFLPGLVIGIAYGVAVIFKWGEPK